MYLESFLAHILEVDGESRICYASNPLQLLVIRLGAEPFLKRLVSVSDFFTLPIQIEEAARIYVRPLW